MLIRPVVHYTCSGLKICIFSNDVEKIMAIQLYNCIKMVWVYLYPCCHHWSPLGGGTISLKSSLLCSTLCYQPCTHSMPAVCVRRSVPVAQCCIGLCARTQRHGQRKLLPAVSVSIPQDVEAQTRSTWTQPTSQCFRAQPAAHSRRIKVTSTRLFGTRDTCGTRTGPSPAPLRSKSVV